MGIDNNSNDDVVPFIEGDHDHSVDPPASRYLDHDDVLFLNEEYHVDLEDDEHHRPGNDVQGENRDAREADSGFRHDLALELPAAVGWKAAEYAAEVVFPGSGRLVKETYRAVQIISAIHGVLVGDGYVYQVGLAGHAGGCIVLRIRQNEAGPGRWPHMSVGLDINFLEGLDTGKADVDGRARRRIGSSSAADQLWPGEWTLVYGRRAVLAHGAVLDDRRVFPSVELWVPVPIEVT